MKSNVEQQVVQDIKNLMAGWDHIMSQARKQFPKANHDELVRIARSAMNHAFLGSRN